MAQERFDIYFAGEILPDHAPEAVREWLGAQFKLQGEALERLFSGQATRIKQGVDMDTAGRYRAAFRNAGALLEVRPATDAAADPAAAASPPVTASAPAAGSDMPELLLLPANTGSLEDCALPIEATPIPDISHMDLDTPDRPLDDTPPDPAADIDISHLTALPPNSGDLSDCNNEKPAQAIPDINKLRLIDE